MNTHPLVQFPEELQSPYAGYGGTDGTRARLVELRTESGTLYVCPSRWQRLRLRWTFRHFRVLPQQVLSRRDQRLIERLSRSALVAPPLPVVRNTVLGVIEKPRINVSGSGRRVVTMRAERRTTNASHMGSGIAGLPTPGYHQRILFEKPGQTKHTTTAGKGRSLSLRPFRQWRALAMLAAVCIVAVAGHFLFVSLPARTLRMKQSLVASRPIGPTARQASPPAVPSPRSEKPKHRPKPLLPGSTLLAGNGAPQINRAGASTTDNSSPAAHAERLFVSELPQGHFATPVASSPSQIGELHLRALIAADGSVKDVTVVSGNPKLAEAGKRAVRRWHYSPDQASAPQAERETLISMRFFGEDNVSVASIAR